jgi:endonuclease YncB( thermonuclease family)
VNRYLVETCSGNNSELNELIELEASVRAKGIGIWLHDNNNGNDDHTRKENELENSLAENGTAGRVMSVTVSEIVDGNTFYVQDIGTNDGVNQLQAVRDMMALFDDVSRDFCALCHDVCVLIMY